MRLIRYSFAAMLVFAVGLTVPAFAQHDHDGDSHHDNGRGHRMEHERVAHERHEAMERHEAREHEDHGRHEGWERQEARREHEEHERREAYEHERRVAVERHFGRIPDDHWHAHFGREHRFVIGHPVFVAGHPRFQYGGYWFVVARPLPRGWRYTDQVYVDYINGAYFMCSPVHPGIHIAINIL